MKKYLSFIIIFLLLLSGCGKENKKDPPKEPPLDMPWIETDDEIYPYMDDEIYPYMVVTSVDETSTDVTSTDESVDASGYFYSLTFHSSFPKEYQGQILEKRFYTYYQVDYETETEKEQYYHHFKDDIDGNKRSYDQNFLPRYYFESELVSLSVLVRYKYEINKEKYEKEIKFKENILKFSSENFRSENFRSEDYDREVIKSFKTPEISTYEDFRRPAIEIVLPADATGYYNIQTWIEYDDGRIIPLIGYYHYRPKHRQYSPNDRIISPGDLKIGRKGEIEAIHYMVVYYPTDKPVPDVIYYTWKKETK